MVYAESFRSLPTLSIAILLCLQLHVAPMTYMSVFVTHRKIKFKHVLGQGKDGMRLTQVTRTICHNLVLSLKAQCS